MERELPTAWAISSSPRRSSTARKTRAAPSAGPSYRVEADVRVDGAPNVLVGLTTTCAFYGQADCAGPALSQASSLELFSDTAGIWQPVMHVADVAGAASSLCSFEIDLLAGLVFDAYLDDLVLRDSLAVRRPRRHRHRRRRGS